MAKILTSIKKHKKPIIMLACATVVATVIYTDVFNSAKDTPVSDYLYTSGESEGNVKILGEAALVDSTATASDENDAYFTNALINKEKSREEALETLQVVVESSENTPDIKDKALSEIMQIASDIEKETAVEEMVKAKGYDDCVAIISGDNINVVVKSGGLATNDIAVITDIVKGETGYTSENIRIIDKA